MLLTSHRTRLLSSSERVRVDQRAIRAFRSRASEPLHPRRALPGKDRETMAIRTLFSAVSESQRDDGSAAASRTEAGS